MSENLLTGLVLAASRGHQDPLAKAGGVSHKCFIDIAGVPMLRRVVESLIRADRFRRILVAIEADSIDEARGLLAGLPGAEAIKFIPSGANIGATVSAIATTDRLPLVITTGDNPLHTPEMVRYFCDALDLERDDGALGLTPARYVLEKYPEGNRAFHRFRDGGYSSCNIYALITPRSLKGPKIFIGGGQFGKKPKRLIGAFGLTAFLIYKSRLMTINGFLRLLSRLLGFRTAPVLMPFAEGPIDVDRMQDWELANRIIAAREASPAA